MTKTQISKAVEEAARLLKENPSWSYQEIINKTREVMQNGAKTNDRTN